MEFTTKADRMKVTKPSLLQLYSAPTANGIKVAAMLEELCKVYSSFDYEPHSVDIRHNESREEDFLEVMNPNGKIPAIIDPNGPGGAQVNVFESGAILLYLAETYHAFLPYHPSSRVEAKNWLFWGSTGFSGQVKLFGYYFKYARHPTPQSLQKYAKEVNRLLSVLERQLGHGKKWVAGDDYTIADLAIWPWVNALHFNYEGCTEAHFNGLKEYPLVVAWYQRCIERPASKKALQVCTFMN